MTPRAISNAITNGQVVRYSITILRGYLHGTRTLEFKPSMQRLPVDEIKRRLLNFRHDERPYENPQWTVTDASGGVRKPATAGVSG